MLRFETTRKAGPGLPYMEKASSSGDLIDKFADELTDAVINRIKVWSTLDSK